MQSQYKVHEGFHLSESTFVEEYCHCIPPANLSVAEIYYQNLSEAHNKAFEAILERTNNSMYDILCLWQLDTYNKRGKILIPL